MLIKNKDMKKIYTTPRLNVRQVKVDDIIITSDPQITDDPSDEGQQLTKRREGSSDRDNY